MSLAMQFHLFHRIFVGKKSSNYSSRNCFSFTREKLALQLILPILHYADVAYQAASKTNLLPLNIVYNKLCRFVLGTPFIIHHFTMYETLNLPSPTIRRQRRWLRFIFQCIHFNYLDYLKQLMVPFSSNYQ